MPASRSARAMIFAPRSCPSRPGLATTTRILRLDSGLSAAVSVVACIETRDRFARRGRASAPAGAKPLDSTESPGKSALERLAGLQHALRQLLAENLFVELADARLRDRLDEREVVR